MGGTLSSTSSPHHPRPIGRGCRRASRSPPCPHPDLPAEQALPRPGLRPPGADAAAHGAGGVARPSRPPRPSTPPSRRPTCSARLRTLDTDVDGLGLRSPRRRAGRRRGTWGAGTWRTSGATRWWWTGGHRSSTPFYRATAADPMDLRRRRRFVMTARRIDDLFDEVFDDPDSVDAAHHGGIPDPLLAELERSRTGEMRDIVATIAAEQDVVIRAPIDTCLVVQGGPGTGKTAVGLHRAAFLLFEHRDAARQGGRAGRRPEPALPPLHRPGAAVPRRGGHPADHGRAPRGRDGWAREDRAGRRPSQGRSPDGGGRWPRRLVPAGAAAERGPGGRAPRGVGCASRRPTLRGQWRRSQERGVTFATGRSAFRTRVRRLAWLGHPDSRWADAAPSAAFDAEMRASPALNAAVAAHLAVGCRRRSLVRAAPHQPAHAGRSGGGPPRRRRAGAAPAPGRGAPARRRALVAGRAVLVDEAEALLNGVARTYGHVVVDEAQDLSAMELRAVARRCPSAVDDHPRRPGPGHRSGGPVVVGGGGCAPRVAAERLGGGARARLPRASTDPRRWPTGCSPSSPLAWPAARSVRVDGAAPTVVALATDGLVAGVAGSIADLSTRHGSVGVVAAPALLAAIAPGWATTASSTGPASGAGSAESSPCWSPPRPRASSSTRSWWSSRLTSTTTSAGGRLLYVALTRAVQELVVVHSSPLPRPLTA